MAKPKLCVCGRSRELPFCDGSHAEEGWSCAARGAQAEWGFCASQHYQNLAHKLAAHFGGVLCVPHLPMPAVATMVWIVDASDLEFPLRAYQSAAWQKGVVFVFEGLAEWVAPAFGRCRVLSLEEAPILKRFHQLRQWLEGPQELEPAQRSLERPALASGFLSHAVRDEGLLMPVIEHLRTWFRAELFVCADSIEPGAGWYEEILHALESQERFVVLVSEASLASHFCSFEIGMAHGLQKPIRVISLDGSRPPAFLQHVHALDVQRVLQQKPWLDDEDVLLQMLLESLHSPEASL